MPTIMLRGLPAALVAIIRSHGQQLGAEGDRACVLALIDYAIQQREARTAGATAMHAQYTPEERTERARVAARARWQR